MGISDEERFFRKNIHDFPDYFLNEEKIEIESCEK